MEQKAMTERERNAMDPCLFDIALPEESFLTPKIKFETGMISPKIEDGDFLRAKEILKANITVAVREK